nr:MAG TPA: hypothetical protein [Caudoviricetes sp.]
MSRTSWILLRLSIERSRKCPQIDSVPLLPSLDNVFVRFSIARCLLALQFILLPSPQISNPIDLFPRKHTTHVLSFPWLRDFAQVSSMATIFNSIRSFPLPCHDARFVTCPLHGYDNQFVICPFHCHESHFVLYLFHCFVHL